MLYTEKERKFLPPSLVDISLPKYIIDTSSFFNSKKEDFRIFLFPSLDRAIYSWGYSSNSHLLPYLVKKGFIMKLPSPSISNAEKIRDIVMDSYTTKSISQILRILNVKYVVERKDIIYNFYHRSKETPNFVKYCLDLQESLKFQKTMGKNVIYQLSSDNFLPHIYSSASNVIVYDNIDTMINILQTTSFDKLPLFIEKNHLKLTNLDRLSLAKTLPTVIFRKINPTRYEVKVENATGPFFLVFLESYHPKWKAYVEMRNRNWKTETRHWEIIAEYPKINVKEAKHEMRFTPKDVAYLFKKPLPEKYHLLVNGYANAWFIDPNEIGKQNFTITLYFWPQSLFYLGLFISGVTLLGCLGYLGYERIKG